ncbi:MAG: cell division protein FtsZ, partial [Alphaproteobacteria bacterium]|nr:cell division protein FtsZ [Alphaproteobacteria bacterium]
MSLSLVRPQATELKPRIVVFGVGGAGGNAVNNMIDAGLEGVEFVVANTDAQHLSFAKTDRRVQLGETITQGLGAGAHPEVGMNAAEESAEEIYGHLDGAHMVFITAGMGGGTGTGAAPVIAKCARDRGILTVGVVTKPFTFEGRHRMRLADAGIAELQRYVDTLIVIPNQNLFRVANERTTFADAFGMADQVLHSGVRSITDLMILPGLINLDFADVRAVMREMGKAMMGTGESTGEKRALTAAEAAIANPLIDDSSMRGARGLLISITGGKDLTLFEVDEAATRIREEVDNDANIIVGATFDETLDGVIRVSVVATGIDTVASSRSTAPPQVTSGGAPESRLAELTARLRADNQRIAERAQQQKAVTAAAPAPARATADQIDRAALAAIAEAVSPSAPAPMQPAAYGDVSVRPIPPKPSLFPDHEEPMNLQEAAPPASFIPQPAERMPVRPARMPQFDELPVPAQNQIRQARGESAEEHPPQKRASLLQRLANVGLGRRDEDT